VKTCIILKFNGKQPLIPFLETRVKKATKKHFQTLIYSFSLVVSLRVKGCAHFQAGPDILNNVCHNFSVKTGSQ
jgi:hypothetical protein